MLYLFKYRHKSLNTCGKYKSYGNEFLTNKSYQTVLMLNAYIRVMIRLYRDEYIVKTSIYAQKLQQVW